MQEAEKAEEEFSSPGRRWKSGSLVLRPPADDGFPGPEARPFLNKGGDSVDKFQSPRNQQKRISDSIYARQVRHAPRGTNHHSFQSASIANRDPRVRFQDRAGSPKGDESVKCANCRTTLGPGEILFLRNVPLCWCCYHAIVDEILAKAQVPTKAS